MGTSRSAGELAHKLGRLAADTRNLPRVMTIESTAAVKTSVEAVMPRRLRGVGKRGSPIRVLSEVKTAADGDSLGRVFTRGQTQLIERDTRAHVMPRQRGPRARRRVVVIPGGSEAAPHGRGGVRTSAKHPGTKGKHLFAKGVAVATPIVQRIYQSQTALAIRRIF